MVISFQYPHALFPGPSSYFLRLQDEESYALGRAQSPAETSQIQIPRPHLQRCWFSRPGLDPRILICKKVLQGDFDAPELKATALIFFLKWPCTHHPNWLCLEMDAQSSAVYPQRDLTSLLGETFKDLYSPLLIERYTKNVQGKTQDSPGSGASSPPVTLGL